MMLFMGAFGRALAAMLCCALGVRESWADESRNDRPLPIAIAKARLAGTAPVHKAGTVEKVANGENARPGTTPWQVALVLSSAPERDPFAGFFCSGTIVGARWVLTAAHCTVDPDPQKKGSVIEVKANEIVVIAGTQNFARAIRRHVRDIHRNGYIHATHENDLALIELTEDFPQDKRLAPIALVEKNAEGLLAVNVQAKAYGWGSTIAGVVPKADRPNIKKLQFGKVAIRDRSICNMNHLKAKRDNLWRAQKRLRKSDAEAEAVVNARLPWNKAVVTAGMTCAGGGVANADACFGDSGGPLVVKVDDKDVQIGVVSWGPGDGCAIADRYGVYALIGMHRDWIDGLVK